MPVDLAEVVIFALFACLRVIPGLHDRMTAAQRAASIPILGEHIGKLKDEMDHSAVVRSCDGFLGHILTVVVRASSTSC